MGRIGKLTVLFIIFLFSLNFIVALDDVDKIYFTQQQEKLVAQVNSKIDTQTNRIETNLKTAVDTAKAEIKTEMSNEIKGSLRAVAIGLSGLIIITLAIFKVIDLKISSTRNIKKYETMMQQKMEELNQLILQATVERNELNNSRMQLADFQKRLQTWERQIQGQQQQVNQVMAQYGMQPMYQQQPIQQPQMQNLQQPFHIPNPPKMPPQYNQPNQQQGFPQPPFAPNQPMEKEKRPLWKSILMFILIIGVFALIGLTIYKFFIAPQ